MPEVHISSWIVWALLSAAFAALTAIFAKVGVENINSDLATFIRTVVILVVLGGILLMRGFPTAGKHLRPDVPLPHVVWDGNRSVLGLLLSCSSAR